MNRAALSETEKAQVAASYNSKGQVVDPHTRQPLNKGKIDIGHRYGYEEKALQRCAERCHMTQKQYNKMIKENAHKLFHLEDRTQNRSHKHECKNVREQNSRCMQLIREFKNKSNGKSTQSARTRNGKSSPKARASKGMTVRGYEKISVKATGSKTGGKNPGLTGYSKSTAGGKCVSISGGKGGTTGGKGSSSGSGKGK